MNNFKLFKLFVAVLHTLIYYKCKLSSKCDLFLLVSISKHIHIVQKTLIGNVQWWI